MDEDDIVDLDEILDKYNKEIDDNIMKSPN
jgi:hypothetical protein